MKILDICHKCSRLKFVYDGNREYLKNIYCLSDNLDFQSMPEFLNGALPDECPYKLEHLVLGGNQKDVNWIHGTRTDDQRW